MKSKQAISVFLTVLTIFSAGCTTKKVQESDYIVAQRKNIVQEVAVTGRVEPSQEVDLAFERGGKVAGVFVNIGNRVRQAQVLVTLENGDYAAQVQQSEATLKSAQAQLKQSYASLDREKSRLAELEKGTRPEEIEIASIAVSSAQQTLLDAQSNYQAEKKVFETQIENADKDVVNAQENLLNVQTKAQTDLDNLFADIPHVLNDTYVKADDAVMKQADEMFSNDNSNTPALTFVTDSQARTDSEYGKAVSNQLLQKFRSELDQLSNSPDELEKELVTVEGYLTTMNHFLNRLFDAVDKAYTLNQTTINTYKANINIGRTNITTALSNISTIKQSIATQKVINQNNLTLAETQVSQADNTALQLRSNRGKSLALAQAQINDARSAVQNAKAQLELKESGTTTEQIDIQKAAIRQAEAATQIQQAQVSSAQASLNNAYVQLQKTVLKAPLSGAVTKQDAKVGQIVSPSISIVSLMSDSKFEIKTNIPEVDIAKVKIGHKAKITLDAYGSDVVFNATVVSIDPAETVIEGIATYLTTLIFDQTDQRVKPGMTANIDIRTDQRENVIVLPQRSIIDENGKKFVILLRDEEKTEKREVVTGLSASDGTIEIVSGLNEGDKVLIESEGVRF